MGLEQIVVQLNPDVHPSGSDLAVVNAARRSFNKRSDWDWTPPADKPVGASYRPKLKEQDKRLIEFLARGMTAGDFEELVCELMASEYLISEAELRGRLWTWRNTPTHESPFGHVFLSFEMTIPIFLARQLVKHKFLRWSEFSRRYITDDVEFYEHTYREAAKDKKQGSGGEHPSSDHWSKVAKMKNLEQLDFYNQMIQDGVAPEQARGCLPQDLMTSVTWSGSLDAFANMCRLRLSSDSQYEAQFVAKCVYKHLENHCPVSAKALVYGV